MMCFESKLTAAGPQSHVPRHTRRVVSTTVSLLTVALRAAEDEEPAGANIARASAAMGLAGFCEAAEQLA